MGDNPNKNEILDYLNMIFTYRTYKFKGDFLNDLLNFINQHLEKELIDLICKYPTAFKIIYLSSFLKQRLEPFQEEYNYFIMSYDHANIYIKHVKNHPFASSDNMIMASSNYMSSEEIINKSHEVIDEKKLISLLGNYSKIKSARK